MSHLWTKLAPALLCVAGCMACRPQESDFSDLRKEVKALRRELDAAAQNAHGVTDRIESRVIKFGGLEGATAQATTGRLTIGGLLQVWAYSIQNDHQGLLDVDKIVLQPSRGGLNNRLADNDSLRIRRAQLRLELDVSAHVRAVTSFDFAREATGFPGFPDNQSSVNGNPVSLLPCQ